MIIDAVPSNLRSSDPRRQLRKNRLAGGGRSIHPAAASPSEMGQRRRRGGQGGQKYRVRKGPLETVRSVRSGPPTESCPFTQCFSRHTDKGTQIPREKSASMSTLASAACERLGACAICVCHNEARILTYATMRACVFVRTSE